MQWYSSFWQLFNSLLIFFGGMILSMRFAKIFQTTKNRNLVIYIWHSLLCIYYLFYSMTNSSDAIRYYNSSLLNNNDFSFGTDAVVSFTRIFSFYFDQSILGTSLIFNIFGSLGLYAFDASLRFATANKSKSVRKFASYIIFLPSISFWSCAIGKDSLSFMACGLALWATLKLTRRSYLLAFAIFVMFAVRPHIAGLMLGALGATISLNGKVPIARRVTIAIVAIGAVTLLMPFILSYSGFENSENASTYMQDRQANNLEGGGAIDITSMNLPMQMFTYMFRPLPFEAHSLLAFAASLDNVILLYLFLWGGREIVKLRNLVFSESRFFLWVYSFTTWIILSLTTANLGISVRQKWMFVPMLIFLLISRIGRTRKHQESHPQKLLHGQGTREYF